MKVQVKIGIGILVAIGFVVALYFILKLNEGYGKPIKRIRFFDDSHLHNGIPVSEYYLKQYDLEKSPRYNVDYVFTNNDDYTHAFIVNKVMPDLSIPKKNVIGLSCEPPYFLGVDDQFKNYVKNKVSKYFIGDTSNLELPFIEKYSCFPWNPSISYLSEKPLKSKLMSIAVSWKIEAPGHIYRHEIVKGILKRNLPVDIYGNGSKKYYNDLNDSRIKGDFKDYEPYKDYFFHICIENFSLPEYFSEKITNSLLCYTTPIYYGCKNIDNYFPNQVVHMTGNLEEDIELISSVCKNPSLYLKEISVEKLKKTLSIENMIDEFD